MQAEFYPSLKEEQLRYETHNNDVEDLGYQEFVKPITSAVLQNFSAHHFGLDFGCGTGPVITSVLKKAAYFVTTYDPIFDNNKEALKTTYDYIVCCEVMEHFHNPLQEFQRLKKLLKPNGKLFCMTELYHENIDFSKWYYKNDPTHVFFYTEKTIEWIQKMIRFSSFEIQRRLIVFSD